MNIDALGHDWDDEAWNWASDNGSAVLTLKCKRDESHIFTSEEIPAEVETEGRTRTYTVSLEKEGKTYSDTRTLTNGLAMYSITIENSDNGNITADYSAASRNTTVKLTVHADKGFELEALTVTTITGETVELKANENIYSFTMPAERVMVNASFKSVEVFRFDDVIDGIWYEDPVYWAVERGFTYGVTNTLFAPMNDTTRAQLVTFLWRVMGEPEVEKTELPFDDVAPDAYYFKAVLWAYHNGVTVGTAENKFSPDRSATRAQIVTLLYRFSDSPDVTAENPFVDVPEEAWFKDAVVWAIQNQITNGTSATTFAPHKYCSRAEAVAFFYAMFK